MVVLELVDERSIKGGRGFVSDIRRKLRGVLRQDIGSSSLAARRLFAGSSTAVLSLPTSFVCRTEDVLRIRCLGGRFFSSREAQRRGHWDVSGGNGVSSEDSATGGLARRSESTRNKERQPSHV